MANPTCCDPCPGLSHFDAEALVGHSIGGAKLRRGLGCVRFHLELSRNFPKPPTQPTPSTTTPTLKAAPSSRHTGHTHRAILGNVKTPGIRGPRGPVGP